MGCGASSPAEATSEPAAPVKAVKASADKKGKGASASKKAPLKQVANKKNSDEDASGKSTPEKNNDNAHEKQKIKPEEAGTPFWEKGPNPMRPVSSRPQSQSGKLMVYKTEKQKQQEELARQQRAASGDAPSRTSSRPGSALPPLAERVRLAQKAKNMVGDVQASNGGAAWAMEL